MSAVVSAEIVFNDSSYWKSMFLFRSFVEASLTPTSQGGGGKDVVLGQKFTTSNFTETVVVNSDSVFGATKTGPNVPVVKKRKLDSNKSSSSSASASNINDELNR